MLPGEHKHRNKNTCNVNCQSSSRVQLCYVVQCCFCHDTGKDGYFSSAAMGSSWCRCAWMSMSSVKGWSVGVCHARVWWWLKVIGGGGNWGEEQCIYLSSQFLSTKILLSLSALAAVEEVGLQHCAMATLWLRRLHDSGLTQQQFPSLVTGKW